MVVGSSQPPSSQPGEMEAHFAALLEPIRDMAKNWDIDVAHHLEEYLEELDKIQITFDGGMTTMNFSQAAFVIQKSACVYSKKEEGIHGWYWKGIWNVQNGLHLPKVEYLYSLVYQVLDLLSNKKKMGQASSVDADGNDQDAAHLNKDSEDEFLILDDVKMHKNIDGKSEEDGDMTKLIPRTPMALIPMDEGEKGENPLMSRAGEVLGSRKDFRLNTSNLHACGTMLLDMSHISQLEISLAMRATSTPAPGHLMSRLAQDMAADKDKELSDMVQEDAQAIMNKIDMDDDDGCDVDFPADNQSLAEPENAVEGQRDGMELGPRTAQEKKPVTRPVKPVVDPWTELDDHEVNAVPEKELRKAKTCKIPPTLDTESTKKRKRRKEVQPCKLAPISEFCAKAFYSNKSKFPSNRLKAPSFPEFEQLYWQEFKLRQQRLKDDKKLLARRGSLIELAEVEQQEQEEGENQYNDIARHADDDVVDDNDDFDMPQLGDPVLNLLQAGVVDEHVPADMTVDIPNMDVGECSVISSYEDMVRQHVEGFLASAQQYAQITELSKRVSEWEDKIIPKLREEELHGPFDIHKYGTKILHSFVTTRKKKASAENPSNEEDTFEEDDVSATEMEAAAGKVIPFRDIASGRQAHDVSRLFLATLQLANNYNVEICSEGCLEESMDTMALKLLSTKRHFEELEEYRAPSLET